ncbi:hypothetical protein ACQPYA_28640 [Micromonospora sp. CA-263727]|uniref:hypothetical protein n=1 Tax=Micromonospora sp. CA-263727 TaxID=3239967 RepID=UPI003D8D4B91
MRGDLDETLARMRRREEALRRRATDPIGTADDQPGSPPDPGRAPGSGVSRTGGHNAGPGWGGAREPVREGSSRRVVEDVVEALRALVAVHPGTSIAARIDHGGQAYDLLVTGNGQDVTVSGQPATPPPAWPMPISTLPDRPAGPDGSGVDPAARLAELIRRDPSLLTGEEPPG